MSKNKGQESFEAFSEWYSQACIDGDFQRYVLSGGKINKSEIAKELGFGRSAFAQNQQIKELATAIEAKLKKELNIVETTRTKSLDAAREKANTKVARTEATNSKLLSRIAMLEEENRQLKLQLSKINDFKTAREAFIAAGAALK